uniref:Uncharacterized protein n=1 Tax=viral metagenome TaxID=1070528 RepID=A0A6M3LTV2_9ZZZZ
MKCFKCRKEMGREDGGPTLVGISMQVHLENHPQEPATRDYNNHQLGKYSNGTGECDVAICFECYIDGLFNT